MHFGPGLRNGYITLAANPSIGLMVLDVMMAMLILEPHAILRCYTDVVARLAAVQERGGEGVVHPKVTTLRREMEQARQREDPGDTEFKVLVVVKREVQWVHHQLEEEFGSDNVALLSRLPEYDRVLHLLEQQSVVVWEEGEALHQLPCSQFNLVVEWEGSSGSSICVDHCTRQNIHVVSFITPSPSVGDKEPVSRNEDRDQQEGKVSINISRNESSGEIRNNRGCGQRDSLMIVASTSVTAKNELHYILTSIFNINLIERNPRDVIIEEGRQGWADLLLDERTCVLLRPLATLRSDAHLNQLTCQLVLLSLQCTTCYIILYAEQSNSSGYEFRSSVMRALTRLVATCVLFHSPEYTVSLLLAYNLHQVGELIRDLCEATRSSSPVWDPEEWTTRPWLTSQMSSHERLLLSFPCINSISAQVILTAMSLLQVLESSFSHMRNILPWIPSKVIKMLFKLVHGEPTTDIKVGRHYCGSSKVLLDQKDKNILHRPMAVEATTAASVPTVTTTTTIYATITTVSASTFSTKLAAFSTVPTERMP
ncbi:hypothetical protein O3P69_001056 [Scylla paramamosain]|uniref:Uncharacterized protein n=1 Tax=Scylla paramamosain TaxID=85552 RepID=A0AAW0UNP3_SCYPA